MLNKISKKRLEKGEKLAWNSTIKAKSSALKKTPLKKVSDKQARLWKETREECLNIWGHKCFLCGANEKNGAILNAHHYLYTRSQRPDLKYVQSNLCCICANCHNHHGVDDRFYQLKDLITNKLFGENKYAIGTPVLFRWFIPCPDKNGGVIMEPGLVGVLENGMVYKGTYLGNGAVEFNGCMIRIGNKFISKYIDNPVIYNMSEDDFVMYSIYSKFGRR